MSKSKRESQSIEEVRSADAPEPVGPYSQAVRCGRLVFASGQIPLDPATGEISKGRVLNPRDARAVGITNWYEWYRADGLNERMQLRGTRSK